MTSTNERMDRVETTLEQLALSQKEFRESQKDTGELIKELRESQKKTDEQIKRTEQELRRSLKGLHNEVSRLTDGWGRFVEGLVAPAIPKMLKRLGYHVNQFGVRQESRLNSRVMEVDVIAAGVQNGRVAVTVAVSVKSRLQIKAVDEHIERLKKFFTFFPQYAGSELSGMVAGIRLDEGVARYAEKQGFYVIGSSGKAVELLNKKDFKPRVWRQ